MISRGSSLARLEGESNLARRDDGIYLRVTRTLLDALLVVLGAVTAFWWFVP